MHRALPILLLALAACGDAEAGKPKKGTGVIKGVVSFEGTPPERAPLDRTSDPRCGGEALSEDVVVTDGKLRDVLVRVKNGTAGEHAAPADAVVVTQSDCRYTPRVVGVIAGGKLEIRNGDPTFHNVRGNKGKKIAFNVPQAAKAKPIVREDLGAAGDVVSLACDVHPWMAGWAVITDHPYFTVTKEDGAFVLSGLAPGSYTVEAWHPTLGLQTTKVKVKKGKKAAVTKFVFRAAD
jgi:hypothetical protein